jgi:hypothetical protein
VGPGGLRAAPGAALGHRSGHAGKVAVGRRYAFFDVDRLPIRVRLRESGMVLFLIPGNAPGGRQRHERRRPAGPRPDPHGPDLRLDRHRPPPPRQTASDHGREQPPRDDRSKFMRTGPEATAWEAALSELRSHLKVVRVAPRGPRPSPWRPSALLLTDTYPFPIADVPDNRAWAETAAEMMRSHNAEHFEPRADDRVPNGWLWSTTYASDPRGWANAAVDWVEFTVTAATDLLSHLDEVGWMAASECLRTPSWTARTRTDDPATQAAETLLSRFGRRARYYVNDSPTPLAARDHASPQCTNDLTGLAGGCITVTVVSNTEVGLFCSTAEA